MYTWRLNPAPEPSHSAYLQYCHAIIRQAGNVRRKWWEVTCTPATSHFAWRRAAPSARQLVVRHQRRVQPEGRLHQVDAENAAGPDVVVGAAARRHVGAHLRGMRGLRRCTRAARLGARGLSGSSAKRPARAAAARVWNGSKADCGATVGAAAGAPSACQGTAPRARAKALPLQWQPTCARTRPPGGVRCSALPGGHSGCGFPSSVTAPGRPRGGSRRWHASAHQQVACIAARKIFQRIHDGQQRQVLQRVAAQDEVVAAGDRHLRVHVIT